MLRTRGKTGGNKNDENKADKINGSKPDNAGENGHKNESGEVDNM